MEGPLSRLARAYQAPLAGYTGALTAYGSAVAVTGAIARTMGRRPPERVGVQDAVLLGVATHKLSRLLSKEAVTAPLRAPFTRYEKPTGMAEVSESPRGDGARHTIGELLNCPFCLAVWAASGFAAGLVFAPRLTRLVAVMLAAVAVSDGLQLGYDAARSHVHLLSEREGTP